MDSPIPPELLETNEEQNLDKELAGYGIDEVGMSLEDKRRYLEAFRNSESTAREEEHSRVGLGIHDLSDSSPSNQPDSNPKHNVIDAEESKVAVHDLFPYKESSFPGLTITRSILKNESNVDVSDIVESPKTKELKNTTSKFTPKASRLSLKSRFAVKDVSNVNEDSLSNDDSAHCSSPPPSHNSDVIPNTAEVCSTEEPLSFKNDLKLTAHKKEDRKRNIDVFNAIKDISERPLVRSEKLNVDGKTPYYVVPHGMNLKDFTVYFNEQLAKIATSLMATQRNSLDFVPWGPPIVVSKSENNSRRMFEETTGPINSDTTTRPSTPVFQNQRYNFRGRTSTKRRNQDDIFSYKDSDEENSEDDKLFPRKMSKDSKTVTSRPTYSSVTDRQSVFSSIRDTLGENEEDLFTDELTSNKDGPSSINGRPLHKDASSDDEKVKRGFGGRVKNICKSGIVRKRETAEHCDDESWVPQRSTSVTDDDADDFEDSLEKNNRKNKLQKEKRNSSKLLFNNKKDKVSKPNLIQHRPTEPNAEDPWKPLDVTCITDDEDFDGSLENNGSKNKMQKHNSKLLFDIEKDRVIKPNIKQHRPSGAQEEENNGGAKGGAKRMATGWFNTLNQPQEDLDVIKPSPVVNPKVRKLLRPNSATSKTNKKSTKLCSQEVDEIITYDEENDRPLEVADSSECPICKRFFDVKDIVNHASDCGVELEEDDDVPETEFISTKNCPICIERFPVGPIYETHLKSCNVRKRRVQPPGSRTPPRNRNKR